MPSARAPFHVLAKPIGPSCNLACDYCFYLNKAALFPGRTTPRAFRMATADLERFVRQYFEAQPTGSDEINFAWQGGEPTLLGLAFFRRVVALQRQFAPPGRRVANALQTNATLLTDEWCNFLHENKFLVGVSLDGPADLHDRFRRDRRGRGSFARVVAAVERLKRHRVEFNTLTAVQRDNGDHPARVYAFLRDLGAIYLQFIPIVEKDPVGRLTERSVQPEQWGDFLNGVFDAWRAADIGRVYVQHFELMLGLVMGLPASLCVHSRTCGRSVALEHNGDLFSCDHFVFPEYRLGNLAEHHLAELLDGPAQTRFGQDKFDRLPGHCRRCEFLGFCYGGCPAHRVLSTPGGEPGLNWLCAGYRRFFAHTAPCFRAMAECLRHQLSAAEYPRFLAPPAAAGPPGRNDLCPCGSGRKYKKCCGLRA